MTSKQQYFYGLVQKNVLVTGANGQLGNEIKASEQVSLRSGSYSPMPIASISPPLDRWMPLLNASACNILLTAPDTRLWTKQRKNLKGICRECGGSRKRGGGSK